MAPLPMRPTHHRHDLAGDRYRIGSGRVRKSRRHIPPMIRSSALIGVKR